MKVFDFLTSKDVLLGLVYIAVGIVYGTNTLLNLDIGTALNMGPGYFPVVLSGLIIAIGLGVLIPAIPHAAQRPFGPVNWRSVVTVIASVLVFAVLARPAGMVIATLGTVLVASLASRHTTILNAVATAVFLAAFCSAVFVYGMGLPIGLLGTWFR